MKWMLIVAVFGTMPVKTDLVFNSIGECLKAEEAMRAAYTQAFNLWQGWAKKNPTEAAYPGSERFQMKRIGLENQGTCIPAG
jgi:hypothetical protein